MTDKNKTIAILGITGSVGLQASDVAISRGYKVDLISAHKNVTLMEEKARQHLPKYAVMSDKTAALDLKKRLCDTEITVLSGSDAIEEGILMSNADTVVNAIIGEAGLMPTLATIRAKKRLALANKESLVIAGDIVMSRAKENGVEIIPVDSEHSAIFQSMSAGRNEEVKKIILTASGGPFFGKKREELSRVTLSDTLNHPTWNMGKKITVDSATLMNKGFEVIEAAHLFGVSVDKIEVVVHRESILHSAVEYIDNTIIGEFSVPDMRMCVQHAVDYPERYASASKPLDLTSLGKMTFYKVDTEAFPLLSLAKEAFTFGGAVPAVLNAANEVAVAGFLGEKIGFTDIFDTVIYTVEKMKDRKSVTTLDGIIDADREARKLSLEFINGIQK